MAIHLRSIGDEERPVLERLWQLYRHDLSEFRDSYPNADGLFKAMPANVSGYFIDSDPGLAGFVLLGGEDPRKIAEFFVVRSYRRQGVGQETALEVLRRHPGRWEIAFQEQNPKAARFWRRIAAEVAGEGGYREERRPVPGKPHIPPDVWLTLTA